MHIKNRFENTKIHFFFFKESRRLRTHILIQKQKTIFDIDKFLGTDMFNLFLTSDCLHVVQLASVSVSMTMTATEACTRDFTDRSAELSGKANLNISGYSWSNTGSRVGMVSIRFGTPPQARRETRAPTMMKHGGRKADTKGVRLIRTRKGNGYVLWRQQESIRSIVHFVFL